jgi:hypothetical protein
MIVGKQLPISDASKGFSRDIVASTNGILLAELLLYERITKQA